MSADTEIEDAEVETPKMLSTYMQKRLPGLLLRRPDLFDRYWRSIPKAAKPDSAYDLIVAAIDDYHKKHGQVPTQETVWEILCQRTSVEEMDWLDEHVKPALAAPDPRDVPHIEAGLKEFVTAEVRSNVASGIVQSLDISAPASEAIDSDKLRDILRKGLSDLDQAEGSSLDGLEPLRDDPIFPLDVRRPKTSKMVPTPWDIVNAELGGMRTGEVFALTGPTGAGKSLYLDEIQGQLIRRGINVFRVDFENVEEDLVVSHAFAMLKQPLPDLTLEGAQNLLRKADEDGAAAGKPVGRLALWCPRTAADVSAADIMEKVLDAERAMGCEFPVVIIDFWDHLADSDLMTAYRNVYQVQAKMLQQMTRYLRNLGKVCYTAFQTNRSGAAKRAAGEQVTMAEVAGSYGKIMAIQFHCIIDRDKQGGTSFKIDKCRRSGKLNGTQIKYEYVAAPCKTMNRGFLRQKEIKVNNPQAAWAAKKVLLLRALDERNPEIAKGLELLKSNYGKHKGRYGVKHGDLAEWLDGDESQLLYALQDLRPRMADRWRPESDFEGEIKVRFDSQSPGRWYVFKE